MTEMFVHDLWRVAQFDEETGWATGRLRLHLGRIAPLLWLVGIFFELYV